MDWSLRGGRLATFAYFALNGFVLGMWIVHIPAIEHQVGISHPVLGSLLLLLGAGGLAGMQLAGRVTDRVGTRAAVPVSAALCSAAVVLPGLAGSGWALGAALVALGFGNGCLDVAMNAHAVQVERGYGRPVMSAFHAVFSVGGVAASLVGAGTLSSGLAPATTLAVVACVGVGVAALAARALLRPEPAPAGESPSERPGRRRTPRRIWVLAALALLLMLSEGVANDWSTLHLRDVLDAPGATAALAYGAFSATMTAGRFAADRVAGRVGPEAVLRYGAVIATAGLVTAALAPWTPVAIAGWAVLGLGLSGCVPQLFSVAGHADRSAEAANVSRVAGLGYLGMLAGPAVIGALNHAIPLNVTFFLPAAFCAVAAATAGILRPGRTTAGHSAEELNAEQRA